MSDPLVSVVIPTFNRGGIIGNAINSALEQTYPRLEMIVVDDGSTDGTAEVLNGFGKKIRIIHQVNAGPSAARNRGVGAATGELIAFLDSDDLWHPDKITRQVALLEKLGPEVPCCLCNIELPHAPFGRKTSFALASLAPELEEGLWHNPLEILLTRFILFNQAVVVRRRALDQAGLFDPDLRLLEDFDLALRLAFAGPWGFIRSPLVKYGVSEGNSLTRWGKTDPGRVPRAMRDILARFRDRQRLREPNLLRLVHRQIRSCERLIFAADCSVGKRAVSILVARGAKLLHRANEALYRRSARWPKMRISSPGAAPQDADRLKRCTPTRCESFI